MKDSGIKPKQIIHIFAILFLFTIVVSTHPSEQLDINSIHPSKQAASKSKQWDKISSEETYQSLNRQLQSLEEGFVSHFLGYYHVQKSRFLQALSDESMAPDLQLNKIKANPGNYLVLLAKMYLYDLLPCSEITGFTWTMYNSDSRYLLAYFYFKIAAERYENAQAYYYIAVLDYYKISPHETVIINLERETVRVSAQKGQDGSRDYKELLDYLSNQRFTSVQQNLFASSMLGHQGASLVLAGLYKEGIGLFKNYKNCTTALAYYLSVIKDTYVDHYEFRSAYSDEKNFQKELYAKRRVLFENDQNVDVVLETEFFDSQTIKAMFELADNYFIGKNGLRKNYAKAAQLFAKLAAQDHKHSMSMLGMCYFKGQGVPLDRKRARVLFEHSSKVSISEAMLIVMDYFEIESQGHRVSAIVKMKCNFMMSIKEIYDKKKDNMNTILKYLFASLIIKGDVPGLKTDDAVLLMGGAAKEGHLMAKISMGLLFADGIDVNYDCAKAVGYFYEQAMSHPFFMDKFYVARFGLKQERLTFSLIKYLELSMIGDTNSFINALYILEIERQNSLKMNLKSWSLETAVQNPLYQLLNKQKIVPDIESFFQKEYSFLGKKPIKFPTLKSLHSGDPLVLQQHLNYMKKKIVKVCAVTKDNSLMHFYDYKMTQKEDSNRLNTIANGSPSKLHVLESRYLLGQAYHKRAFKAKQEGNDYTKDQYNALQEYKRATSSPIIGKMLFYFEEIMLNSEGVDLKDDLFDFGFFNDFLTFTLVLSIVVFVLYYKRSKKLDQIHRKQLEKRYAEIKTQQQQGLSHQFEHSTSQKFNRQIQQNSSQNSIQSQRYKKDQNQPEISEQRPILGYRIGSSLQDDELLVLREYKEYEFDDNPTNIQKTKAEQKQTDQQKDKEEQKGQEKQKGKEKQD